MQEFIPKKNNTGLQVFISERPNINSIPDEVIDLIASYIEGQLEEYLNKNKKDK